MRRSIVLFCVLSAAGCNQPAEQPAANNAAANTAATPKQPVFCFFKEAETKGWAIAAAAKGGATVTGKAHVKDARYKAQLGEPEVQGGTAKVWLSIANNSGYASPDDWWDVTAAIPAGVQNVSVMCGDKSLAELALKKG